MINKTASRTLFLSVCALWLASYAPAQETVNYSSVGGRVTDPSGALVEGAQVIARQIEANISSTETTDRDGRFRFPYLKVGEYEIAVRHQGFQESTRHVTLTVGAAFELPFELVVGAMETKVTVNADSPVLEGARTQVASTISQNEVKDLPLSGRNYFDIALFVAGVSPTNTAANQLFAETSAMPGQGISIGSQRNFSNGFIIDGVSANDDAAGVAGAFIGLDVVDEFQVVTSGGQAELGRALGGYVNVVTKSGGNIMHGDVYGYFRNSRFNSANPLSNTVLPLTQAQYGASLSGPIKQDKTFYFANFEARDLNQSGFVSIPAATAATINARLTAVNYPGPLISTGDFRNPVHNENFFGKVDHHFSDTDQFSMRYSLYHVESINSRGAGGTSAPTASADLFDTDQTIAASNVKTLSSRLVNETRVQLTNSNLAAPPSDPIGPAVSISGVASFGTLSGSPTARVNRLYEGTDSLSVQQGAHAIRVGVDFLYNDDTITFPRTIRGSYAFSSLANFLSGTYNSSGFTQTFDVTKLQQTNPNAGFYAQDEYKVTPSLTLNLGLRYDLEFLKTIATQTGNVSPRGGFAWSPFASRKTVVRGGYGLFYDRIPLRPLANALLSADNTTVVSNLQQLSISLSPTQAGAPAGAFDVHLIRRDFPILAERVNGRPLAWLDNAATTQKPRQVIERLKSFYEHENSNVHRAAHELAARATDAYEAAREKVRAFLNARSANEVVFVRGATEAINLVAQSWGRQNIGRDDEIVISWLEHHANIVPWQQLANEKSARLRVIPVDEDGQILLEEYSKLLGPKTKLVSFAQVSNALGTVTPAQAITAMAHAVGARVLVDGAQSVSHMRTDVQALNSDWFVFSGHKIFGPTGIGVVQGREELLNATQPWQGGGNMISDVTFEQTRYQSAPARFEAGTGNIADAVGLGAALDYVTNIGIDAIAAYEHQLLEYATRLLKEIPGLRQIGTAPEKASVLSFVLEGYRTEDVGTALNKEGIAVRSGHHCAQPILRRFGVETTVRPSLAFYNTCEEVDRMIAVLIRLSDRRARL